MNEDSPPAENSKPPLDASMLNGLPDPVFLVDPEHRIVDYNRAARWLLVVEAVGSMVDGTLNNARIIEAVDNTLEGTPETHGDFFLPFPVARHYELNVWRLPDLHTPAPAWAMVVLHDVTATRKAEEMRADFVANVSHELRSPLSSLLGFIETLRGPARNDQEATEKFLEIMESEARRMTRLINDLLKLSKVETDEHIRPEDLVELGPVLSQVADILSLQARKRGIEIVLEQPDVLPPVTGDSDELIQVFENLVSNAITYGRAETPIRVRAVKWDPANGNGQPGVSVSVINEGEGIPAENVPRLTERFYRADKGRSRGMGGTGLGLAIVKHIVARHRGHLEIESTPGRQTRFTVSLPSSAA